MTTDVIIAREDVNVAQLDAELRRALGEALAGISARGGRLIVHLTPQATGTHAQQALHVVRQHNAEVLTADQQQRLRLLAERARFRAGLNAEEYSATPLLYALAARLAWLEQEVRALHQP